MSGPVPRGAKLARDIEALLRDLETLGVVDVVSSACGDQYEIWSGEEIRDLKARARALLVSLDLEKLRRGDAA